VAVRHASTAGKQAITGMLDSARITAATGMQGTPAGEATISIEKTAGSVWNSYIKVTGEFGDRDLSASGRGFCQEWQ
jgi:hypothetical protein